MEEAGKPENYMVVGQNDVSHWLQRGWELYGSPMMVEETTFVRQAMIKRAKPTPTPIKEKQ